MTLLLLQERLSTFTCHACQACCNCAACLQPQSRSTDAQTTF